MLIIHFFNLKCVYLNSTIIVNNYGFFEIKLIETEGILNYLGESK